MSATVETSHATRRGRLLLVPNTLDLGTWKGAEQAPDIQDVLPLGVLRQAAHLTFWVAESAKVARALLKRVDAVVPLAQPIQALEIAELPRAPKGGRGGGGGGAAEPSRELERLLRPCLAGHDVGLVSDAGLPAVADPGSLLVRAAHRLGIDVVPLAGPSSLVLAVAASGMNGQSFAFVGYLPSDAAPRSQRLRELESHSRRWQQTQVLIETPYRNRALGQAMLDELAPATWLSVSQGLTLVDGWSRSLTISDWRRAGQASLVGRLSPDVPAVFAFLAT